jgi:peptidylprolyl isomerase
MLFRILAACAFGGEGLIHSRQELMEHPHAMRHSVLILLLAASAAAGVAQTPAKPATGSTTAAKPAVHPAAGPSAAIAAVIKAPASIPPYKGIQKPIFTIALRYQEIKIGTGALAETGKMYKIFYTGYRAADGVKFDSTSDHPRPPLRDKEGKPMLGDDGKPKLGDIQPFPFHQGVGATVPGFDQGFAGMKVGGKRRIFIPWQLAYGSRTIPDHGPDHPGIPAKSDLIFDVELVDVTDAPPPPPARPPMGGMPGGRSMPPGVVPHPVTPPATTTPGTTPAPGSAPAPGSTPAPNAAPATPTAGSTSAPPTAAPNAPATTTPPPTPTPSPNTATPAQPQSH